MCSCNKRCLASIFRVKAVASSNHYIRRSGGLSSISPWQKTRQWRFRCKRLSFLFVPRYILAVNQGDLQYFTLKTDAIWSSETSVLTRTAELLHISENTILHCYCRENINSYKFIISFIMSSISSAALMYNKSRGRTVHTITCSHSALRTY
jgi:hypothetical protein